MLENCAFGQRSDNGELWQAKLADVQKLGRYPDLIRHSGEQVALVVDQKVCPFSAHIVCSDTETWAGFRLWPGVTEAIAQKAWDRMREILRTESIGAGEIIPFR